MKKELALQERIVAEIEWLALQVRQHPSRAGVLLGLLIVAVIVVRAILGLPRLQ